MKDNDRHCIERTLFSGGGYATNTQAELAELAEPVFLPISLSIGGHCPMDSVEARIEPIID